MESRFRYLSLVVLGLATAVGLRLFMLTDQSLWYDEGWTLHFSQGDSFRELVTRLSTSALGDRFQPLYHLIMYVWRDAVGNTDWSLRIFSALCGSAAVVVSFWTSLRLFGKRRAVASLWLVAVSGYLIMYSQEVRPYAFLILLAAIQFAIFSRALTGEPTEKLTRWQLLFGVVTGISIYANIFMAFLSTALCVSYTVVYRNKKEWIRWWGLTALLALPALIFHVSSPVTTDPTSSEVSRLAQPIVQNTLFVPYGLLVGTTYGPPMVELRGPDKIQVILDSWPALSLFALVCATLLVCLVLALRARRQGDPTFQRDCFLLGVLAVAFPTFIAFSIATAFNWQPRHSFFLHLPIMLLLSMFFDKPIKLSSISSWGFRVGQAAVGVLLLLNLHSLSNYFFEERYERDDYRSAVAYLEEHSDTPSVVLFGLTEVLEFYGYDQAVNGNGFEAEDLAANVREATHGAPRVLIIVNREFYWEQHKSGKVVESMSPEYREVDRVSYQYFNVYTFERSS